MRLDETAGVEKPVRGTVHVHTRRSDGSGTVDDVAAAAGRAGLDFVIFSDHGDATRAPLPPAYRHGVLCIDAVEIATFGGHLVAIGLDQPTAYPLGGEPRDVVADVRRLGGIAIAAHPTSAKPALRWSDWDVPLDGVEWLNADSEWRDEGALSLLRTLLTYPVRRSETIARLLDRPDDALARWDQLTRTRRVTGLAASDAHASLGASGEDNPYGGGSPVPLPGYAPAFRTFSLSLPDVRLTGEASGDAAVVTDAIRNGHLYSTIDGRATPARLTFTGTAGTHTVSGGAALPAGRAVLSARTNAPAGSTIRLLRGGNVISTARGAGLRYESRGEPGAYRVEVYLPGHRGGEAPWIVSNPIYLGLQEPAAIDPFTTRGEQPLFSDEALRAVKSTTPGWGIEKDERSTGAFEVERDGSTARLAFRYRLSGPASDDPWVAFGMPAGRSIAAFERIAFRARADRPMRLWVQLWMPTAQGNQYWRRSVFLDGAARDVSVAFTDLTPVPASTPRRQPPLDAIVSLMFAVDAVHTPPGRAGQFWIDDLRYQR
jgi:hypothetical protein